MFHSFIIDLSTYSYAARLFKDKKVNISLIILVVIQLTCLIRISYKKLLSEARFLFEWIIWLSDRRLPTIYLHFDLNQ